jgi:hypothetical protein
MNSRTVAVQILSMALVIAPLGAAARATPLDKIDRAIQKQPAYKSSPRYCLLVFGPEADARVWLVIDGNTLYMDRDADGDLTKPQNLVRMEKAQGTEQVFKAGDVVVSADGRKHANVRVERYGDETLVSVEFDPRHRQIAGVDAAGNLELATTARAAPIIHFGGPLMMQTNGDALHRGDTSVLYAMVGTPGIGTGTFASIQHLRIAPELHPVAEVQIAGPGKAPPVTQRVVLSHRC